MEARADTLVRPAGPAEAEAWDRYVQSHPGAAGYHQWGWVRALRESMGLTVHALVAWRGSTIVGLLPLAHQHLWPLRPSLISLPFVNYGGLLASDVEAESALLDETVRLSRAAGADRVELRHHRPRAPAWARREDKARFVLDLSPGAERLWASLPGPRRTQTRRAQRDGLTAAVGGEALLDDFYRLVAREWWAHGSPILPRRFYATVLRTFPDDCRICLVSAGGRVVAAGFLYRFGTHVENPWLGTLPEGAASHATTLLSWSMIEECCRWGAAAFDFGRSTRGSGPYVYKQRWGAVEEVLPWSVWPESAAAAPDASRVAAIVKTLWRRLPIQLANHLGPPLARHLPL